MMHRLLVVLDECAASDAALTAALGLASEQSGAVLLAGMVPSVSLAMLPVLGSALFGATARQRNADARVRTRIDWGQREAARRGLVSAVRLLDPPHHAESVVSLAEAEGCTTIVIASGRRSALGRLLTRILIPGLITHASMPILFCKATR